MPLNPKSDVETGIEQLEADRTVALTGVYPADPGETLSENEVPADNEAELSRSERAGIDGLTPSNKDTEIYDASRDPRTGRPPNPLEAQRLAREHERNRSEGQAEDSSDHPEATEDSAGDADVEDASEFQAPARMTSPKAGDDEKAVVDALVEEGVSRERAEELVAVHGPNWEALKAAAFAGDN